MSIIKECARCNTTTEHVPVRDGGIGCKKCIYKGMGSALVSLRILSEQVLNKIDNLEYDLKKLTED